MCYRDSLLGAVAHGDGDRDQGRGSRANKRASGLKWHPGLTRP